MIMNVSKAVGRKVIKSDAKSRRRGRKRRVVRSRAKDLSGGRISYLKFGKQAVSDLLWLKRFVNTEIHYLDNVQSAVNMSTTATFVLLNGMQLGDTAITRTGQSIKMDALDLNAYVTGNLTAVQTSSRILIVLDKQPNGAIFAIGNLLNSTTSTSMFTVGGQSRFVVLFDNAFALSTGGPLNCQFSKRIQLGQHTEYNTGNAGDITDINTNSLYLVFLSDQGTNFPIMTIYLRLWFIDN